MQRNNVFLARRSSQKNISRCQHGKQASQRGGYAYIVKSKENGHVHAATKKYLCSNSPIITTGARAVVKMAGKLAMLAVLVSCKRLCVSELRSLAYNVCNLSVRRCAVDTFSARHGKQSQNTETNATVPRQQWPDWSLFVSDSVASRKRLHDNQARASNLLEEILRRRLCQYPTRSLSSTSTRALFAMVSSLRR